MLIRRQDLVEHGALGRIASHDDMFMIEQLHKARHAISFGTGMTRRTSTSRSTSFIVPADPRSVYEVEA